MKNIVKSFIALSFIIFFLFSAQLKSSDLIYEIQEILDQKTQRMGLSIENDKLVEQDHILSGSALSCIFWGSYLHVDYFNSKYFLENLDSAPFTLKNFINQEVSAKGYSKISFDISNNSQNFTEQLFYNAGLKKKALIYKISVSDAWNKINQYNSSLRQFQIQKQVFPLTLEDIQNKTACFSQLSNLYCSFNKTMNIPALFKLITTKVLENGGGILLFQSQESDRIEGMISYGKFCDKDGQQAMLVDSLFVSESHRNRKISPILIYALLQQANKGDFKEIHWETGLSRLETQKLYQEKFGIEPCGYAWRYATPAQTLISKYLTSISSEIVFDSLNSIMNLFKASG